MIFALATPVGKSAIAVIRVAGEGCHKKINSSLDKPINTFGAPARGATVKLYSDQRIHAKTIDAGSGYLCQMEPVAHFGIRENEKKFEIKIKWTNGDEQFVGFEGLNQTLIVKQRHYDHD